MESEFSQKWSADLKRIKKENKSNFIIGVEISKPKPWPPAEKIIKLSKDGVNIKQIAKETGYSVQTIERNIKTKGEDPRTGLQCEQHHGKVFSIDEALSKMPIPCGKNCVCYWRPIFRDEIK